MLGRSSRGYGRPRGRSAGRRSRRGDDMLDVLLPDFWEQHQPRRAPVGRWVKVAARNYARWVMRAPDTRGLGTGLAAWYPVGQVAHHYAADDTLRDSLLLGAFAPPAALAAWVATYKTHGSPRYSGAIAAIAAGAPLWLATAAHTGITNLPTLLGYTVTATTAWSAYTWSDVLKQRRRTTELQAKWETIANLAGLEDSRLLRTQVTRTGVRFKVDVGVHGPSVSRLERGELAVQIARCYGIGAGQVRVTDDAKNARILWITVQLKDLWSEQVPHPAITDPASRPKGHRSILDGPFVIGVDPETGDDLELTLFDEGGARHVEIVATNGGGKSNTLSNIVQQAAECRDVLTIAIDLGKGVIPSLWGEYLHEAAGVGEEDKALQLLEWIDTIVDERAIACAGGTHTPTPQAPVILLIIDEQDTATGMDSPIADRVKPVLDKVHRRGRSGGVVAITAKQRNVVQHTGTKEGSANTYTKIVGRVSDTKEMAKAVPDWEAIGCPDMSTYGSGAEGVVLLVKAGGVWQAGRTRALYDPDAVKALAASYGPADATLEPHIAAQLPGYTERHPIPAAAHATTRTATDTADGATAANSPNQAGGVGSPDRPRPATTNNGPAANGAAAAGDGDTGWGFDPTNEAEVDKAAKGLVAQLDEFINETASPPDKATTLDDLHTAQRAITNTTVPDDVTQAVVRFLADRGRKGARRDELIQHLGMATSTAARRLGKLVHDKIIVRAGNGKAARYYLPDHNPTSDHEQ